MSTFEDLRELARKAIVAARLGSSCFLDDSCLQTIPQDVPLAKIRDYLINDDPGRSQIVKKDPGTAF